MGNWMDRLVSQIHWSSLSLLGIGEFFTCNNFLHAMPMLRSFVTLYHWLYLGPPDKTEEDFHLYLPIYTRRLVGSCPLLLAEVPIWPIICAFASAAHVRSKAAVCWSRWTYGRGGDVMVASVHHTVSQSCGLEYLIKHSFTQDLLLKQGCDWLVIWITQDLPSQNDLKIDLNII